MPRSLKLALPLLVSASMACSTALLPGAGDGDDEGGKHDDQGARSGGRFVIVTSPSAPCPWSSLAQTHVCPPESNDDLFRYDLDRDGAVTGQVRLTDNDDGVGRAQGETEQPDDDVFIALSPDRAWLYFGNQLGGGRTVYRMASDGSSEAVAIGPGGDTRFVGQSSDGATVYLVSQVGGVRDLYAVAAAGGEPINLSPEAGDVGDVGMLPGGDAVLIERGGTNDPDGTDADRELYRLDLGDRTLARLTDNRVADVPVGATADGATLLVLRYDDADGDGVTETGRNLYAVALGGDHAERKLTSLAAPSIELMAVTADGGRAIYEYRPPYENKQVFAVRLDGGGAVQLSHPASGESSYYRTLSSDGADVVFTSNDRVGGYGDTEIYRVAADGGQAALLTDWDNDSYFLPFAHAAASDLVLYTSPIDGDDDLYAIPLGGGEARNLSGNDGWADDVAGTSPDGGLVFFRNLSDDPIYDGDQLSPDCDLDLYVTASDGAGPTLQITDNQVEDALSAIALPPGEPAAAWAPIHRSPLGLEMIRL
jgi:dipeptidyl aminopeptidase/acylaminoacyl peptidase